jgi:hypothetical protein
MTGDELLELLNDGKSWAQMEEEQKKMEKLADRVEKEKREKKKCETEKAERKMKSKREWTLSEIIDNLE